MTNVAATQVAIDLSGRLLELQPNLVLKIENPVSNLQPVLNKSMNASPQFFLTTNENGVVEIHSADGLWASIIRSKTDNSKFDVYLGGGPADSEPQYTELNFDQVAAATQDADVNTDELDDFLNQL